MDAQRSRRHEVKTTTRNGVRVRVVRFFEDGISAGSTVEADCGCLGMPFRVHSRAACPNRLERAVALNGGG